MNNSQTARERAASSSSLISAEDAFTWLDNLPVCTKVLDLDFKLLYISSTGAKELKLDNVSDYYGKPYPHSCFPESTAGPMLQALLKVKETGQSVTLEARTGALEGAGTAEGAGAAEGAGNAEGEEVWFRSTISALRDDQGQIARIMIASTNITAQKKSEENLRVAFDEMEAQFEKRTAELYKSEERFSMAMRGANDGLWDWDFRTNDVYYSPRWKSMLGFEANELAGTLDTWGSLVHPEDKVWVLQKVQDYIEGKADSFEAEMRMHHKQGHEVIVLSRAFMVHDEESGKPIRLVGTHVDITEREETQQLILKTSDILTMIATGKPSGEIYEAIALLYESRHPGLYCSMLSLQGNKLMHGGAPSLPKTYCDAVDGLEYGPCVGSCGTSTFTGERVIVDDIATDPKWDKLKHIALPHGLRCCWSEPIKDSSGKVLGAFGMYYDHPRLPNEKESTDLTSGARLAGIVMERDRSEKELKQHRQHLEELVSQRTAELEEAKKVAEQANRAKTEFLSSMSHELRTPMNAILGFGQILGFDAHEPLSPKQRGYLDHIMSGGKHLLELIDQVLDLAKIESEKLTMSLEEVSIDEVCHECLSLIGTQVAERRLRVEVDMDQGYIIEADYTRLKQVLLNLLSNAIKYNREGGHIKVSSRLTADDMVRISVADSGIGIAAKQQGGVFEPFNRLGREASGIEGTGVGLTIAKQLVEAMGGHIDFESEVGSGSTFWIEFPQIEPVSSELKRQPEAFQLNAPQQDSTAVSTVLYIEDNPANLNLMQAIIGKMSGISLLSAHNAELGLVIAEERLPDLILMDINLPGMDGIAALKLLRTIEATQDIPVIAITAAAMKRDIERGKAAGFKTYLTKPFNLPEVIEAIEKALDR